MKHYYKQKSFGVQRFFRMLLAFGMVFTGYWDGIIAQCSVPSVSIPTFACGAAPTITASGSTGLYRWYDVPTGGTPLGTGSTFSPGTLYSNSNLVYYVEAVDNISAPSCVSPRAAIMLQPTPLATPVVSGNTTVLCGGTTTLSASASASYINWYTQPSGGTPVYSGASFSIPPVYSSGITYYVEAATHPGPIATVQFNYTGGQQTWVVPPGVTSIDVDVVGASGGNSSGSYGTNAGGKGGRVQATLSVTPGQTLYIYMWGARAPEYLPVT